MNYKIRGTQVDFFNCTDRKVVYSGAAGTGKSYAALLKLYVYCHKYPGLRCLIVRDTRSSLTQSTLVTFERDVVPADDPILKGASRQHRSSYKFPNGSEIVLGGMSEPERVLSTDYNIIYIEEATVNISREDFELLDSRARDLRPKPVLPFQQVFAVCNPSTSKHWLYKLSMAGEIKMIKARHTDNPSLFNEDGSVTESGKHYLTSLSQMERSRRRRFFLGEWIETDGLIFPEFDTETHIVDHIPSDVTYYGAIDWGYNDPGVAMVVAKCPDGCLVVRSLTYRTHENLNWWSERVKRLSQTFGVRRWVCDNANPSAISIMKDAGIPAVPCKKGAGSVNRNIALIKSRLSDRMLTVYRNHQTDTDPRLESTYRPVGLIDEFQTYQWESQGEDKPEDANNHAIDALGYLVNDLDNGHNEYYFVFGNPDVRISQKSVAASQAV